MELHSPDQSSARIIHYVILELKSSFFAAMQNFAGTQVDSVVEATDLFDTNHLSQTFRLPHKTLVPRHFHRFVSG